MIFFGILLTLQVFMFFMIFQLIPPVLLFPTNYCFLNQVIPPLSGVLGNKSQPLNMDIMYSEISSEMQDCLFSNLGIVGNMKPTDISSYSIPERAYGLRNVDLKTRKCLVMPLCLIKGMSKFNVFDNIIFQKYEPQQMLKFLI